MKTFEVEIWIEDWNEPLIYQTSEASFKDAHNRGMKSVMMFEKQGIKCELRRVQKISKR